MPYLTRKPLDNALFCKKSLRTMPYFTRINKLDGEIRNNKYGWSDVQVGVLIGSLLIDLDRFVGFFAIGDSKITLSPCCSRKMECTCGAEIIQIEKNEQGKWYYS